VGVEKAKDGGLGQAGATTNTALHSDSTYEGWVWVTASKVRVQIKKGQCKAHYQNRHRLYFIFLFF
jgi:hypothetical protein